MLATAPVRTPEYRRREPEKEPLYQILAGHLETFLQHTRTSKHQLPLHVEKEIRAYLECGILAYGFVRARCEDYGKSRAVAFSCKKRGFCPSCSGRRMADTAAPSNTRLPPETRENPSQRCSEHARTIRCDDKRYIRNPAEPLTTVSAN